MKIVFNPFWSVTQYMFCDKMYHVTMQDRPTVKWEKSKQKQEIEPSLTLTTEWNYGMEVKGKGLRRRWCLVFGYCWCRRNLTSSLATVRCPAPRRSWTSGRRQGLRRRTDVDICVAKWLFHTTWQRRPHCGSRYSRWRMGYRVATGRSPSGRTFPAE